MLESTGCCVCGVSNVAESPLMDKIVKANTCRMEEGCFSHFFLNCYLFAVINANTDKSANS